MPSPDCRLKLVITAMVSTRLSLPGILLSLGFVVVLVASTGRRAEALDPAVAARELIALTNLNRTVNGLSALLIDGDLSGVAHSRSDDMIVRNYFAHEIPPDGRTVVDVLRENSIGFRSVGENIEWNTAPEPTTLQFANNDFMNSPPHRANIMNTRYTRLGAGLAEGLPKRMYTVVFVGRADDALAAAPAPAPQEPAAEAPNVQGSSTVTTLTTFGTTLSWETPAGTTQYHLQVIPANNDGPGINIIRSGEASFTVQPPVLGEGPYIMLPGMSYSWRVRTSDAASSLGENDPTWGVWTTGAFRTPVPSSAGISPLSPAPGSRVPAGGVRLQWENAARDIFYYELQVSPDARFGEDGARASVWHNLIHGGVASPENSWETPMLQRGATYFWRVRPRVQGDGEPVAWSQTWSFVAS